MWAETQQWRLSLPYGRDGFRWRWVKNIWPEELLGSPKEVVMKVMLGSCSLLAVGWRETLHVTKPPPGISH